MDARIGVAGVQSVGPCPAKAFQADAEQRQWAEVDLLKSVGVGQFTLKKNRSALVNGRRFVGTQKFIQGRFFGAVSTNVVFEVLPFEDAVGKLAREPVKRRQFALREQDGVFGQRER
tara:strand:- start:355 stop:705 length:351 start_codon:yes stop_codon:yes gene_type:complete